MNKMIEQSVLRPEDYSFPIGKERCCVLKIPTSENDRARNSYIAFLLRDMNQETKTDALKSAKEKAKKNSYFINICKRTGCEGCRTLKLYERKLTPKPVEDTTLT